MKTFRTEKFVALKEKAKIFFTKKKKEIIKNTNIVKQLVKRNVKIQYRNSGIGVLWTVLNPLLNMLVMYFVFSTMFGYDDATYPLYILCGNIIFNVMRTATVQALPSLVYNRGLLTKNKISYNVFPLASNLSSIVNFLFSFVALLAVMAVVSLKVKVFSGYMFLTLAVLPALFLFSYGVSLMISALYVYFRDTMHFYNVFLTLWMYMTPIFYRLDRAGDDIKGQIVKGIINLNPMYHFTEYFRAVIYGYASESMALPGGKELFVLYLIGAIFAFIGTLVFSIVKRNFIFHI